MLEKIKLALRISHDALDSDIEDTIELARVEMIRAGVKVAVAASSHPLIVGAIKTFCQYTYGPDKYKEGFFKSWEYQVDSIRKSTIDLDDVEEPAEPVEPAEPTGPVEPITPSDGGSSNV